MKRFCPIEFKINVISCRKIPMSDTEGNSSEYLYYSLSFLGTIFYIEACVVCVRSSFLQRLVYKNTSETAINISEMFMITNYNDVVPKID